MVIEKKSLSDQGGKKKLSHQVGGEKKMSQEDRVTNNKKLSRP